MLRAQGVLPSAATAAAAGLNRYREETAPVPQYVRAVGAPLPQAAGTGVHVAVRRDIENLLAGERGWGGGPLDWGCFDGLAMKRAVQAAVHYIWIGSE